MDAALEDVAEDESPLAEVAAVTMVSVTIWVLVLPFAPVTMDSEVVVTADEVSLVDVVVGSDVVVVGGRLVLVSVE